MEAIKKVRKFWKRESNEKLSESEPERKRVTILVDFENLYQGSDRDVDLKRFGQFLDYISFQEKKDVIALQVFVPAHLTNGGASLVYHLHNAEIVFIPQMKICPRNFITKMGKLKDVDGVDWQISVQVMWLVENVRDLDEIVVVSDDYDFSWAKSYAKRHGVSFKILPVSKAYARDYSEEDIITEFLGKEEAN